MDGRTDERRTNTFREAVCTPIRYVTLHFRARHEQLRYVTEIAPKSPFLCENRSLTRYGRTDGRTDERTKERMLFVWQCEHLSDM